MSFLVVMGLFTAGLFAAAYFTKRRLGLLGLALAAGATLSSLWVGTLTPLVAQSGVLLVRPPLSSVLAVSLTLLPAVLLLFSGPTYKNHLHKIIGSSVFALLAIAFMLEPLMAGLVIDDSAKPIAAALQQYQQTAISIGLILAVIDLIITKAPKPPKEHGH